MAGNHAKFKGFTNVGDELLNTQLENNLISYCNYAMLEIGGFTNVTIPTSGFYGGSKHQLRPRRDPGFIDGQVWEGFRKEWVWETGIDYGLMKPIRVSGVFVNGTFQPTTGVGSLSHYVDYPHGRVIFTTPVASVSTVTCNHSYRFAHFGSANAPWFREFQFRSLRLDNPHFSQFGSGDWSQLIQSRVQLPFVGVEVVPRRSFTGMQLGGGQRVYQDVVFHILAETAWERDKLFDVLSLQNDKNIYLYDLNKVGSGNAFPLDSNGSVAISGVGYVDLVTPTGLYFWKQVRFVDNMGLEMLTISPNFYGAQVRTTIEVNMGEI